MTRRKKEILDPALPLTNGNHEKFAIAFVKHGGRNMKRIYEEVNPGVKTGYSIATRWKKRPEIAARIEFLRRRMRAVGERFADEAAQASNEPSDALFAHFDVENIDLGTNRSSFVAALDTITNFLAELAEMLSKGGMAKESAAVRTTSRKLVIANEQLENVIDEAQAKRPPHEKILAFLTACTCSDSEGNLVPTSSPKLSPQRQKNLARHHAILVQSYNAICGFKRRIEKNHEELQPLVNVIKTESENFSATVLRLTKEYAESEDISPPRQRNLCGGETLKAALAAIKSVFGDAPEPTRCSECNGLIA